MSSLSPTTPQPAAAARLLVVDDQPANIQIVGRLLGGLGFEILPATDGEQAMKCLAAGRPGPDLVLLDVLMEGLDGFEVCRRIRANPDWADIPVIFLSAADDKELTVRALEAGGVDYVTKPFNQAELVSRVRTHLALKAARDRLKRLAEDKDELLGILAHDCKNHLGGMHMTAQLLCEHARTLGDGRLGQMAENIEQSSALMLAFVKEFLANSAADRGLLFQPQPICLNDAVSGVARRLRETAHRKQLNLRVELAEGDAKVTATGAAMDQVLDNLLSNAIKFSPPGKQIVIGVRSADQTVECYVRDQGPGFSEQDKLQLFRRYVRLSARPTGGEPSTGLGLSIVRKLVEAMNGQVVCESVPGGGTTFFVRLPHATSEP
jgi:two-component system sensor histidine kinase/response regulator